MSNFWPVGLQLDDIDSPKQILETAKNEWESNSKGIITMVFQDVTSQSGNQIIIVHGKHVPSSRTAELFSIIHRPNAPYPARINCKSDDLPNVLKKSYFVPGKTIRPMGHAVTELFTERQLPDQIIKNQWVSETPAEFRSNLSKVISLGSTKSELLNLLAQVNADPTLDTNAVDETNLELDEDRPTVGE